MYLNDMIKNKNSKADEVREERDLNEVTHQDKEQEAQMQK